MCIFFDNFLKIFSGNFCNAGCFKAFSLRRRWLAVRPVG